MNNLKLVPFLLGLIVVSFFGCSKSDSDDEGVGTSLSITVNDNNGKAVEGANVSIFKSLQDLTANQNPVTGKSMVTNAQGKAVFTEIPESVSSVYVKASKGSISTMYGASHPMVSITHGSSNSLIAQAVAMTTDPGNGNSGDVQQRVVLLEEVTAQGCPNCPRGHSTVASILNSKGDRVVPVAIHALGLAKELKIDEGQKIATEILKASYQPQGSVNRSPISGSSLTGGTTSWASKVNSELDIAPKVNLELSRDGNQVKVKAKLNQNISAPLRVTVLITENNIKASQSNGGDNYNHMHVLRDVVTAYDGDALTSGAGNQGDIIEKSFSLSLNGSWKTSDIKIVAFVHEFQSSRYVHQAAQISY
ncbi:hypothetical protein FUAX_31340 [Fulvitalea axinellae]|uniref:Outer membrane protein Omp28 n=1 Tax=Fulvitalea axinellae TaxID=1182444 RepID=A0AAU9CZ04_9BACT|nr:hypothetical protein FUAX_31340 [Fulvitalea axinellae]